MPGQITVKKLCFVHCGESCNCEAAMKWKLSDLALGQIDEINRHIVGGPNVFFPPRQETDWMGG